MENIVLPGEHCAGAINASRGCLPQRQSDLRRAPELQQLGTCLITLGGGSELEEDSASSSEEGPGDGERHCLHADSRRRSTMMVGSAGGGRPPQDKD